MLELLRPLVDRVEPERLLLPVLPVLERPLCAPILPLPLLLLLLFFLVGILTSITSRAAAKRVGGD